jgi:hypothetical protein
VPFSDSSARSPTSFTSMSTSVHFNEMISPHCQPVM